MKEIRLTQGKVALVDDEDYEKLSQFRWYAWRDPKNDRYYAGRNITLQQKPKLKATSIKMAREILGVTDPKTHVDHIDGNTLNNVRSNLREATPTQNQANRTASSRINSLGFRGIAFDTRSGRSKPWRAQINLNGKRTTLGTFASAEEAARAFDKAAKELYGEFCGKLNFE